MTSDQKATFPSVPCSQDPKEGLLKERLQKSLPRIPVLFLNCVLFWIACYTSIEKILAEDASWTLGWSIFCLAISVGFIAHLKLITIADHPKPTKNEVEFRNRITIFFFGIMVLTLPISLHNKLDWYSMCITYAGLVVLMVSVASLELPTENDAPDGSSEAKTHLMQYPLSQERMEIILMYTSASVILAITLSHKNDLSISAILLLVVVPLYSVSYYKFMNSKWLASQRETTAQLNYNPVTHELNNRRKKWWRASHFLYLTTYILLCMPLISPSIATSMIWQTIML